MNTLNELRDEIDTIDDEMQTLLLKRIELVKQIGQLKKENNLPIEDKNRESEIAKIIELKYADKEKIALLNKFQKEIISLSKEEEEK